MIDAGSHQENGTGPVFKFNPLQQLHTFFFDLEQHQFDELMNPHLNIAIFTKLKIQLCLPNV